MDPLPPIRVLRCSRGRTQRAVACTQSSECNSSGRAHVTPGIASCMAQGKASSPAKLLILFVLATDWGLYEQCCLEGNLVAIRHPTFDVLRRSHIQCSTMVFVSRTKVPDTNTVVPETKAMAPDTKTRVFVAKKMALVAKKMVFVAKKIFFVVKQKVLAQRRSSSSQSKKFWRKEDLLRRKAQSFSAKKIFFVVKRKFRRKDNGLCRFDHGLCHFDHGVCRSDHGLWRHVIFRRTRGARVPRTSSARGSIR